MYSEQMKRIVTLLGCLVTGFYAASFFLVWILAIIGFIFSEDIRTNIQDMLRSLSAEGLVGFLLITQLTIVPLIVGWISYFFFKKYKSLK